ARGVPTLLAVAFLLTLAAGVVIDLAPPRQLPLERLADAGPEIRRAAAEGSWLAGNRRLLAAMNDFEDALERESRLAMAVQPRVQELLVRRGGAGNEQAYLGRDGWLFFRPDVDYATGPPFLAPRTLERRARGGDAWKA